MVKYQRLSNEQLEKLRKTDFSKIEGMTVAEDDL